MNRLLDLLNGIRPMSMELTAFLISILEERFVPKGGQILTAGQISRHIYFIQKGLVRGYEMKKEKEVTTWLMKENDIIFSPESFLEQAPSQESIMALEDTWLIGTGWSNLDRAYELHPEFNRHGRIITEKYYLRSLRLNNFLTRHTAAEKFEIMHATEPELCARVPDKYMATYLDMTPETFSKIKSDLANGKRIH